MRRIYLLLTIGLISQGCASGTQQGSSGGNAVSPTNPTPALNASCPVTPTPNLVFIIHCRETVNGMPDVLARNGTSVFSVTKASNITTYTLLSVGAHTTGDGRSCQFEVKSSGEVEDL